MRVEIQFLCLVTVLLHRVERTRQPFQHFSTFVVYDPITLLIPKEGNAVLTFVRWIVAEIELVHELAVEEVVGGCIRVSSIETPAWFTFRIRAHNRNREVGLEVLEMSDQVWTVGKRTEEA